MDIFGPPDVKKLKAKKDIKGLIAALQYRKKDRNFLPLRVAAAEALGDLGEFRDTRAIEPFLESMWNNILGKQDIIMSLAKIGEPAVKPLIEILTDENRHDLTRCDAMRVLGKIKDPRAVEPLIAITNLHYVGSYHLSGTAAYALGEIGDARAIDTLVSLLIGQNQYDSKCAAEALEMIGDQQAIAPLMVAYVNSKEKRTIEKALESLYQNASLFELIELLKQTIVSQYLEINLIAVRLISKINDPAAFDSIIPLLKDPDPTLQLRAVEILRAYRDKRAVEPLIDLLDSPKRDIRSTIIDTLGELGDLKAVAPIISALKDEDKYVKSRAILALGRLRDIKAVNPLIDLLAGCVDIKSIQNVPDDYRLIVSACSVLGDLGDLQAEDSLIRYTLQGVDDAAKALGKLGDVCAVGPLIESLENFYQGWDYNLFRLTALKALVKFSDPRSVDILIKYLDYPLINYDIEMDKNDNTPLRCCAAEGLGKIGDPRAIQPLEDALKLSENKGVIASSIHSALDRISANSGY